MFFMISTVDIASYPADSIPYSVEKNQCGLEKKYKRHESNFSNGSMKKTRINVTFCHFMT